MKQSTRFLFAIVLSLLSGVCLFALMPGLASAASTGTSSLPILVYHQIRISPDGPPDSSTAISLVRFEEQMKFLHAQGYVTLSMDEVIQFMKDGKSPAKRIVAIHFDDGWLSAQYAVPVLNRFQFKASFWIIAGTGIGWPHMDWDAVQALASNPRFDIFSHTMTHPWKENETLLDWLDGPDHNKGLEKARWELVESRHVLEQKLHREIPYLAWPRGLYNDTLIELAREAGYKALLTIDDGVNLPGDDLRHIRRTIIDGGCNGLIFQKILSDGRFRDCSPQP